MKVPFIRIKRIHTHPRSRATHAAVLVTEQPGYQPILGTGTLKVARAYAERDAKRHNLTIIEDKEV